MIAVTAGARGRTQAAAATSVGYYGPGGGRRYSLASYSWQPVHRHSLGHWVRRRKAGYSRKAALLWPMWRRSSRSAVVVMTPT